MHSKIQVSKHAALYSSPPYSSLLHGFVKQLSYLLRQFLISKLYDTFGTSLTSLRPTIWKVLLWLGVSDTLSILRLLQSILTILTTMMIAKCFDMIVWVLTKRSGGISTLKYLSLSPATGIYGILRLITCKRMKIMDKAIASMKLLLIFATWLSGIVLFAKTRLSTFYAVQSSQDITGGVGPFRGSYVSEFLSYLQDQNPAYNKTILPYSTLITASQLVVNPAYVLSTPPILPCNKDDRCNSYLLPGGPLLATPRPPSGNSDYPTITIHNAPAMQLDFSSPTIQQESFSETEDCSVYGEDGFQFGFQFCLIDSKQDPGTLLVRESQIIMNFPTKISRTSRLSEWHRK